MQPRIRSQYLGVGILLLALGIRSIHLNQSFWLDEAAQALESARPLAQQLQLSGDFQPPLFHLIVFLFEKLGKSEWWLRLASVIPGLITLWFAGKIAQKFYGEKVGLLTMLLGSLSAFHFYYSLELRPYSLAAMFATLSMYYFLQLSDPSKDFNKLKLRQIAIGYVLSSALALYSMYLTGFLLLTQLLITLLLYRNKVKSVLTFDLLVILLFLPWLPSLWQQLINGIGLASQYAGWSTAVSLPWFKSLPLTFIRFMIGMIRVDPTLPYLAGGLICLALVASVIFKAIKTKSDTTILLWLIAPIILAFLVSFFVPVLEPKRLLFCLPALWILLAKGLDKLQLSKSILPAILVIYALPLFIHWTDSSLLRENWRSAVTDIESTGTPQSVVLFAFPGPFAPFTWYQTKKVPTISTGIFTLTDKAYLDQKVSRVLAYDRVYVFEYLMDLSDPKRLIFAWLKEQGYVNSSVRDYRGVGFVYVYDRIPALAILP